MEPPANSTSEDPELFTNFITEVKAIEKRDSVLTSAQQIDRLLKPGSTYRNLNPYEVLQLDPETSLDIAKKQYRKLSFLVHPDKNPEDLEKAQQAFEAVNKAWKTLEDEDSRQKCLSVIQEAKERTDYNTWKENEGIWILEQWRNGRGSGSKRLKRKNTEQLRKSGRRTLKSRGKTGWRAGNSFNQGVPPLRKRKLPRN
uniref:DnaJ homolog subfamily C member 8 n=1 Tax=Cacopsylla melanoneura TaxID=428564 RepID=A0A8D8V7V7_9HEMI